MPAQISLRLKDIYKFKLIPSADTESFFKKVPSATCVLRDGFDRLILFIKRVYTEQTFFKKPAVDNIFATIVEFF